MITLPREFEQRMKELLQDEFPEFLRGFEEERHGGVRFNSLKINKEEWERIAPFATLQVPWIHNGYYYSLNDQPAKHPYYFAGIYYIQEPSAMTPAEILPVKPGDRVLDICAAPGGKSFAAAIALGSFSGLERLIVISISPYSDSTAHLTSLAILYVRM